MSTVETVILRNLIHNEEYTRHVLPFIKKEFFLSAGDAVLFETIKEYFEKYNANPSVEELKIELSNSKKIPEQTFKKVLEILPELHEKEEATAEWLIDTTEKFCKDKAIYNAIMRSIQIIEGTDKELTENALPSLLQDALSTSFDKSIGHDFFEDAETRYDQLHMRENRIRFDLELFNKITKGGVPSKTLNVVLAGTNVGKSLFLCHLAASYIKQGHNVLYITAEMAEERIAERIDCNLLDMQIDEVEKMSKGSFTSKITSIQNKTHGKLIIKEYPTSSAHAGHFKALLDELEIKKSFKPKVIIIDYLNICAPQRQNRNANSYTIIKNIAEELRALAVEYDVPVWTATQTNRGGFDNSDVSLTDTSESFGLPMTVDFMFAMVRTEELDELGQVMCIQLKSRYNNVSFYRKFVVGVDITMFKLFDVDQVAQNDVVDDKPSFDRSKFGEGMRAEKYDFNFE
jgi:replicative DNA helicase